MLLPGVPDRHAVVKRDGFLLHLQWTSREQDAIARFPCIDCRIAHRKSTAEAFFRRFDVMSKAVLTLQAASPPRGRCVPPQKPAALSSQDKAAGLRFPDFHLASASIVPFKRPYKRPPPMTNGCHGNVASISPTSRG